MIELSKRKLNEMSHQLCAYDLGCRGIYDYENAIYYLWAMKKIDGSRYYKDKVNNLIENIRIQYGDNVTLVKEQLAYSCGTYGNNGQLHVFHVYANGEIKENIYTYVG